MKTLFASLVAAVLAFTSYTCEVAANEHPYVIPSSFPAGDPIPAATTDDSDSILGRDKPHPKLHFQAKRDGVYMNGKKFTFKGANYFGMETEIHVPHGLWGGNESTTIQKIASMLKENHFNAVRLPFAVDAVLNNTEVDRWVMANEANLIATFDGRPVTILDVMDYTIKVFADNKILVLLDAHVLKTNGGIGELWYTSESDKNDFENAWKIIAARYRDTWNVIGADLKNEPHGIASWGSSNASTDWRLASREWANSILRTAPHWLIFVEGMQFSSRDVPEFPCFWGENLMDVKRARLTLPVADRLVYSPHVYGPDVYNQAYFGNESFPANMPAIWDLHFGFVEQYGAMVVGEWGGKYRSEADIKWQNQFAAYLKEKQLSSFYWSLNPNSGDTEGLLENDWSSPRTDKLAMLSAFVGTPIP